MNKCKYLNEKMIYEERELEKLCPNINRRANFILSNRGRELCGYCIEQCPDRSICDKYKEDAK